MRVIRAAWCDGEGPGSTFARVARPAPSIRPRHVGATNRTERPPIAPPSDEAILTPSDRPDQHEGEDQDSTRGVGHSAAPPIRIPCPSLFYEPIRESRQGR